MSSISIAAFTADTHLSDRHPVREKVLKAILRDLEEEGPGSLIIAGDLLDKDTTSYRAADSLFLEFPAIDIHLIPGNHDPGLRQELFTARNVKVYSEPKLVDISDIQFLFIPYSPGQAPGGFIEPFHKGLSQGRWVLVSHGESGRVRGGYTPEEDAYFPLYRTDIERYAPGAVIMGHIHNISGDDQTKEGVFYPGSPAAIDRNETGIRKYGIITDNFRINWRDVSLGPLYWNSSVFLLPSEDEEKELEKKLGEVLSGLKERFGTDINRLKLYLKVYGCSSIGRDRLSEKVNEKLAGEVKLETDFSGLSAVKDDLRSSIASGASGVIEGINFSFPVPFPEREKVLRAALEIIYGKD